MCSHALAGKELLSVDPELGHGISSADLRFAMSPQRDKVVGICRRCVLTRMLYFLATRFSTAMLMVRTPFSMLGWIDGQ